MADRVPIDEECAALLFRVLRLEGFFPELSAEHVRKLFPNSALELHAAQAPVLRQGDSGRDLYVIESGEVSVTQTFGSAGAELSTLGPGQIFGEMGLIRDGMRTATVTAVRDSRIFRLAFADLLYLLKNNAALGAHLQALAAGRS